MTDRLRRWGPPSVFTTLTLSIVFMGSRNGASWPVLAMAVALVVSTLVATVYRDRHRTHAAESELVSVLGARVMAAEAAHERKEEILHELKATVGGVAMASQLLCERGGDLADDTVFRLEEMRQAELQRLQRLLADDRPALGTVDVDRVVSPLVVALRSRGHAVRFEANQRQAFGRDDDVAEIVHILLENAARHAPGSRIVVRVEERDERIRVVVQDSGPGVPRDMRARIFERGERAETSPGQGIGLTAARRLAVEMNGDLRLEPDGLRPGACFTLEIPAAPAGVLCHARSA